jgi:hypothetical protein
MMKRFLVAGCLGIIGLISVTSEAAMVASGKAAPLTPGRNILAASGHNDSPGSSDLSLILQLKSGSTVLVDEGSPCKAIQPKQNYPNDADPTGWTRPDFDDSAWQDAKLGIGYGDNDDNTVLGDGANATIYSRTWFDVANPLAIKTLTLGVDYDDDAVVYINGVEVARTAGTGIPEVARFDSWSDNGTGQSHEASKTDPPNYEFVEIAVTAVVTAVHPREKLAAIWGSLKR